jgi:hypothetical protein
MDGIKAILPDFMVIDYLSGTNALTWSSVAE